MSGHPWSEAKGFQGRQGGFETSDQGRIKAEVPTRRGRHLGNGHEEAPQDLSATIRKGRRPKGSSEYIEGPHQGKGIGLVQTTECRTCQEGFREVSEVCWSHEVQSFYYDFQQAFFCSHTGGNSDQKHNGRTETGRCCIS